MIRFHSVEISGIFAQILRDINFGKSRSSKTTVFAILGALSFAPLVNFNLKKVQKSKNIKIQSLYRPVHSNWDLLRNIPLMKNPQFLSNFVQTLGYWPTHGMINFWKFEQNQTKIVNFLLMAYFLASLNWGEQVCSTLDAKYSIHFYKEPGVSTL